MKLSELIEAEINQVLGGYLGPDDAAAAITARLHECVKPLEWRKDKFSGHLMSGIYEINTYTNQLFIYDKDIGACSERELMDFLPVKNDTLEAAKAAAQDHYAAQIIAGLDL